ncbi:MAG: hypothetical protein ACR2MG_05485 [Pyrinomonadaceae bacterium]
MFQFEIEKVDFLPAAKIWCLTGKLICGEIHNNSIAFLETDSGTNKIRIGTVAFIDPPNLNGQKRLTLTIKSDGKTLKDFVGKIIASKSSKLRSLVTV